MFTRQLMFGGGYVAKRVISNNLEKTRIALDKLPRGSVVIDRFGHAWQGAQGYGPFDTKYANGYWYRAYDGKDASEVSTWDLSFFGPLKIVWRGDGNP